MFALNRSPQREPRLFLEPEPSSAEVLERLLAARRAVAEAGEDATPAERAELADAERTWRGITGALN